MIELMSRCPGVLKGAKIALVASTKANYGMQRMLSLRAESLSIRISAFLDVQEAEHWLGADTGENADQLQV